MNIPSLWVPGTYIRQLESLHAGRSLWPTHVLLINECAFFFSLWVPGTYIDS